MMHVLTRGGGLEGQDTSSSGPAPIQKHATPQISEFVSDQPHANPMNDPGTRQCGAKTRSGEPCRRSPAPGKASAVSMVVRLAVVRQLASVMGHGRAADTAKRSHPYRDTRPGRITGPRRGRRTPPWQTFPTSARSYRPYGRNREREYRSELRAPRVIMRCARCLLFEWGDIGER